MKTQDPKLNLAIVVTAIVVGCLSYLLWGTKHNDLDRINNENNLSLSQSSSEYAVMGDKTWNAFGCSALASIIGNTDESERLFKFGYEQGSIFLKALKANKISKEDISSKVPVGVMWLIEGPTNDFILGRILENAQEDALEEVFKTGNEYNSKIGRAHV